jgi:hypothetical protein
MTYNSTITLKGITKPIIVSKTNAETIQTIFANSGIEPDFVVTVGKQSFRKGDIKFVDIVADGDDSRKWDATMHEFYDEERVEREKFLKLPVEARAKRLDMFFYLYKIAMKVEPTTEILNKAYEVQLEFFKANPQRTLCDFNVLKALIPNLVDESSLKMWDTSKTMFREVYLRLVEKAIFRDMQLGGHFTSIKPKPKIELKGTETPDEMKDIAMENRKNYDEYGGFVSEAVNNF